MSLRKVAATVSHREEEVASSEVVCLLFWCHAAAPNRETLTCGKCSSNDESCSARRRCRSFNKVGRRAPLGGSDCLRLEEVRDNVYLVELGVLEGLLC